MVSSRIRVASLQYFIRPVSTFDDFQAQVEGLVETAADYRCQLVVFPEYFTVQLLTLGDVRRPMREQIRTLAGQAPRFRETMTDLAKRFGVHIVAGTMPVMETGSDAVYNECLVVGPDGSAGTQGKLHLTRFEHEEWKVSPRSTLQVFETGFGRMAVAICYDVEFPEIIRAAAREQAHILVVPSCTDDRQAFLRVRYCAQARAIENQMYVIHSCTVGSLPMVPAVSLNYGQASILTPSDFPFSRDGILAEGSPNQEMMVVGELNLGTILDTRSAGTVLPLFDSTRSAEIASSVSLVPVSQPGFDILVRHTRRDDFAEIAQVSLACYPDEVPWTAELLARHLEMFPEGQFVAVDRTTGRVVGMAASLVVRWDDYDLQSNWQDFTANGTFRNHDPEHGRTLYGAEIMVLPTLRRRGIAKRLYEARKELAMHLGLLRIRAGARLRGYHRYAGKMSAADYVNAVVHGTAADPTLSFQLAQGFRVLGIVKQYLGADRESLGHAAVIEWLNPRAAHGETAVPTELPEAATQVAH
jgi:predicted amidohydrolase/ribosomal protein S18 acetylase RimI-like enzyme